MKKFIIVSLLVLTSLTTAGCRSNDVNNSGNPVNRSLLIDTGFKLGGNIPILPFPLPELDLGFRLNFRRPTIQEEVDLNLSKVGKWKTPEGPPPPPASPTPFSATPKKE